MNFGYICSKLLQTNYTFDDTMVGTQTLVFLAQFAPEYLVCLFSVLLLHKVNIYLPFQIFY